MFAWQSTLCNRHLKPYTDIAWNGMILRADVTLLHTDVTQLPIHTCTQQRYIILLRYMYVPTFTQQKTSQLQTFIRLYTLF